MARAFQHELDHLDGRLLLDLLDKDQRKAAMKELRRRVTGGRRAWPTPSASSGGSDS